MNNVVEQKKDFWEFNKGDKINTKIFVISEIAYKSESGWGSYVVQDAYSDGLFAIDFVISGVMGFRLIEEKTYDVEGIVEQFRGRNQIKVKTVIQSNPVNKMGLVGYLKTFDGLGERLSERIWDKFGIDGLDLLRTNPKLVANEIVGLSLKRALKISEDIKFYSEKQTIIVNLLGYGISHKDAESIYRKYGLKSLQMIQENPYLLTNIANFSFEKADKIAINIGIEINSMFRLTEGIIDMLEKISDFGHCYIEEDDFIIKAVNHLSYKLDVTEMYSLLKENSNKEEFKYVVGGKSYNIKISKLANAYQKSVNERNSTKREYLKYKVVELETNDIVKAINTLKMEKRIKINKERLYLKKVWDAENSIVDDIYRLSTEKTPLDVSLVKKELDDLLMEKNIKLEDKQYEACLNFNLYTGGFYVLTGNAGCGKTFTLSIIYELANRLKKKLKNIPLRYKFFAPTGKASKVMRKSTGKKAQTIHMGLGFEKGSFNFCRSNQFETDFLVVDETSMLNIFLCSDLLEAIKSGTKVIFMGDIKQLPSIGAGNILNDLIESNVLDVIELDVAKRQNALSSINENANNIIYKKPIESSTKKDFLFVSKQSDNEVLDNLLNAYIKSINKFCKEDVQILTPQKSGVLGVNFLNYYIQQKVNNVETTKQIAKAKFKVNINGTVKEIQPYIKVGDKVINTKNQYDLEWYEKDCYNDYSTITSMKGVTNGETGIIEDIKDVRVDGEKVKRVIVKFEDGYVFFDDSSINNLELAYSITIHKAQGSQWFCVLIPIVSSHSFMLDNNLLYTAVTRATDYCFCFGQYSAMIRGINESKSRNRKTSLKEKLRQKCA